MSVYFITAREVGRVKIGLTACDPVLRLNSLNASSPIDLRLEAVMPGDITDERAFHRRFSGLRIKGEWFSLCPAIEELIAANPFEPGPRSDGSVEAVIARFGTASKMSRKLGIPFTTIASWKEKGRIPAYRMDSIAAHLEQPC